MGGCRANWIKHASPACPICPLNRKDALGSWRRRASDKIRFRFASAPGARAMLASIKAAGRLDWIISSPPALLRISSAPHESQPDPPAHSPTVQPSRATCWPATGLRKWSPPVGRRLLPSRIFVAILVHARIPLITPQNSHQHPPPLPVQGSTAHSVHPRRAGPSSFNMKIFVVSLRRSELGAINRFTIRREQPGQDEITIDP